ncbi:MAG: RNA methyltransferase, partial [Rhodospirillaceae bacterium]|nr:RNA methyltransferase [Rhodospirillaceae bacterium]
VVLENARAFETTEAAIADLGHVYATTARARDMTKDVVTPRHAATEMRNFAADDIKCGVLFGKEAWGLHNDDVALSDAILMVPLNPAFSSLNLAQAVLLMGYEWFQSGLDNDASVFEVRNDTRPATKEELVGFFEHLEAELDDSGFLRVLDKRPNMVRNLRNLFQRARMSEQEVRSMRGVIASLVRDHKKEK